MSRCNVDNIAGATYTGDANAEFAGRILRKRLTFSPFLHPLRSFNDSGMDVCPIDGYFEIEI